MPVEAAPRLAPPNSRPLYRLIRRTRALLRLTWAATGLALAVGLFLGALGVVIAADLLLPLLQLPFWFAYAADQPLRLAGLLAITVPPAIVFLVGVVWPLVRRLPAGDVARRIEARLPGIHNRLVSCLDLEKRGRAAASPVFYRRLLTEALERIRGFRPRSVVDFRNLGRAALVAVVGALVFAGVCVLFGDRLHAAVDRLTNPFADLPPVSGVRYAVTPGSKSGPREKAIAFSARVSDGEADKLSLQLWGDHGATHVVDLEAQKSEAGLWQIARDGPSLGADFTNGFRYRVHGGGTWSPQYAVKLLETPRIVGVRTDVYYPKYMGDPQPHPTARDAVEVIGPEGGEIEMTVLAEGQVARGEVQLLKPGVRKIAPEDQVERVWFAEKPPAGAAQELTWKQERMGGRPAHTEDVALDTSRHFFQNDPVGHKVEVGDVFFAYVYLSFQHQPEEILLQWTDDADSKNWNHAAFWGADKINEGKAGTASRLKMGGLPVAGEWVRLEVPASKLELEGKTVRGMSFVLKGGQCWWSRTGTVRVQEPALLTMKPFPMHEAEPGRWVGRLPLKDKGLFRAELRNEADYPNKPMTELRYTALPDQKPTVLLRRPTTTEVTLPQPQALPLSVEAYDDYGVKEINLLIRDGETGPYQKPINLKTYAKAELSPKLETQLQQAAALKMGGLLRFAIEAKDNHDQTGQTADYVVRIAADPNAPDPEKVLDKTQDDFREGLLHLIAEQKKVKAEIERINGQYAEMTEKIRADQPAPKPATPDKPDPTKPPEPKVEAPKLDPETAKKLDALEKELAALAKQEEANAQTAAQLNNDLGKMAEQANNLQTLPQPLVDQIKGLQQTFEQTALKGLQDLAKQINQGADPKQAGAPDVKDLEKKAERLQQDLESLKKRADALNAARKGLRDDLAEAIKQLQREMLNESGKLDARDLEELKDFIAKMREQLKDMAGKQENLQHDTEKGGDLADLEKKQEDLDKQLEKMLADAKNLLDAKRKANRRKPEFPNSPYHPDGDETKVPPKEDDTNDPLPGKKDPDGKNKPGDKNDKDKKADDKDDEEPLFMPALPGSKLTPDKRFDKKKRPTDKKLDKDGKPDPDAKRDDLESHQDQRLDDLKNAEQSLAADQQTLEQMLQALANAMKSSGQKGKDPKGDPGLPNPDDAAMQELAKMLQSSAMQQALAMAQRMRQGPQPGKSQQPGQQPPPPSPTQLPISTGVGNNTASSADLDKLDPAARAALLKLPPRLREDLLQGLRERGPEGYGPFIEDYFKRLTEAKEAPKP